MSRTVLIVEGHPTYFCSHRLPWARRAAAEGYDVHVTALKTGGEDGVREEGFPFHPIADGARGQNPLSELGLIVRLGRLLRRLNPDLAHFITLRAVLYGALPARLVGVPAVLNSVTGLGVLFARDGATTRALRWGVVQALRVALAHPNQRATFQNPDDAALFTSRGLVRDDAALVTAGSGVDPERFACAPEPPVRDKGPVVMLPTRLLWPKGLGVFANAARRLRARDTRARFVIVGGTDPENPASAPKTTLRAWHRAGLVEWWGPQQPKDMPDVLRQAHVVCLPSHYREGVPRVLLEAAATGRPVVTTDVPGCREIVHHGENGFLVPPKAPGVLADRIGQLLADRALRREMGTNGRARVVENFTAAQVAARITQAYGRLLAAAP